MIPIIIDKIDGYNYDLKDEFGKCYHINIEFYGLDSMPKVGDYMYFDEYLLKEKLLNFEVIDEIIEYNKETALLILNHQKFYLKRCYG